MEQIETFIKHWPRAVLLMILGGVIGLHVWMFSPKTYTASVTLAVGIDYNRTGTLTDLEEDRLLGISEDIIHSDEVMAVPFALSDETEYADFFRRTTVSRTNSVWTLSVNGKDAELAGKLALSWLDAARERLLDAQAHALKAEALRDELEGLTRCVQYSAENVPASVCPVVDEGTIDEYAARVLEEEEVSHGLPSAVRVGAANPNELTLKPASRGAAYDTLLGALCGLIAAFAIVWLPAKKERG